MVHVPIVKFEEPIQKDEQVFNGTLYSIADLVADHLQKNHPLSKYLKRHHDLIAKELKDMIKRTGNKDRSNIDVLERCTMQKKFKFDKVKMRNLPSLLSHDLYRQGTFKEAVIPFNDDSFNPPTVSRRINDCLVTAINLSL